MRSTFLAGALRIKSSTSFGGVTLVDEQTYMDFTTTRGQEYCEVVPPLCEQGAEPHDGYEVFGKVYRFGDITP